MKFSLSLFIVFLAGALPSQAMSTLEINELKQLDPATRLEQRCDVEAMERITKHEQHLSADKVLAYAFSDPVVQDHAIIADGAAFRSRERWYKLSFACQTSDDQMTVMSFKYTIGDEVPESEWAAHYLVP